MKKFIYGNKEIRKSQLKHSYKAFVWLLIVILMIILLVSFSSKFNLQGWKIISFHLKRFFSPINKSSLFTNSSLWYQSFYLLWKTLAMIILSNISGFSLAFISALSVSKIVCKQWLSLPIRSFILFLRAIPVFIFASAFVNAFPANWASFLVFTWFTWLWLHKYLFDIFESLNLKYYYHYLHIGKNKISAFYYGVILLIWPRLFSLYLFSFESNFKWITLLQAIGIISLGELILYPLNSQRYEELLIPLFIYLLVIILSDFIAYLFNKFLYKSFASKKTNDFLKRSFMQIYGRLIILSFVALITFIFSLFALLSLESQWVRINDFPRIIKASLQFNFSAIFAPLNSANAPFNLILEIVGQALLIFFIATFFGFIIGVLQNEKMNSKWQSLSLKIIGVLFRSLPVVIIFILSSTLWNQLVTVLIFALSIVMTFTIAKHVSDQGNILKETQIEELKNQGHNYFKIVTLYYFPMIKNNLKYYLFFRFTEILRTVIFYGAFGASRGGNILFTNLAIGNFEIVSANVWIIIFAIILIETSPQIYLLIKKILLKIKTHHKLNKSIIKKMTSK